MLTVRDVTLVVGLGNRYARDDAVGLVVVREARRFLPPAVRVLEHEGEPIGLLDAWSGTDHVVLVDAVRSEAPAGTIHRFDALAGPLPEGIALGSTHALGLAHAVELGRTLGRLPARATIVGVEGARFDAGEGLTPAVRRAADDLARELNALVR